MGIKGGGRVSVDDTVGANRYEDSWRGWYRDIKGKHWTAKYSTKFQATRAARIERNRNLSTHSILNAWNCRARLEA